MQLQPAPLAILFLAAVAAAATLVCTLPGIPDPTAQPRPAYTPYPTFTPTPSLTPERLAPVPLTVQPFPRYFPHPQPATPVAALPEPTIAPTLDASNFVDIDGDKEWVFGQAVQHAEDAERLFEQARYLEAIEQFTKAQDVAGPPQMVRQHHQKPRQTRHPDPADPASLHHPPVKPNP